MVKRKTYRLRGGDIIDVEEFHDGNYGAPGRIRAGKKKPTREQIRKVNAMNKARRCRLRLLEYFTPGDLFGTWTYEVGNRPPDMKQAQKDFQKAIRKVREQFKKRGYELFWIRNIEQGTKGAWHIHFVINEIGDTASIVAKAWEHGGTYISVIRLNSKLYDPDFTKLAAYMTKDGHSTEVKKDGTPGKPRLKDASYSTSRNMPLPEPDEDQLKRWKKEPAPKKGYYMVRVHEGVNPVTGYLYRRYTMARLSPENEWIKSAFPGEECG